MANDRKEYNKYWWKTRGREYNGENKEKIRLQKKEYYERNKEEIKKRKREKYKMNKKPITQEQREYNRRYFGDRYKNDIQFNLRMRMCNRFNGALIRYTQDEIKPIARSKNIDYMGIIEHLKPFPESLLEHTIDHIIPLDFFDLTDSKQVKKAWNPINLQWLNNVANISKNNTIDFEKYPEQKLVWAELGLSKMQTFINEENNKIL